MDKVTCELQGGLGNQLFQIATTLAYGEKYNKFATFENIPYSNSYTKRRTYFEHLDVNFGKLTNFVNYDEIKFSYSEIPEIVENVKLNGYFQTSKYFDNIDFHNFIKEPKDVNLLYNELTDKYETNNLISIHVRRGDYLKLPLNHPCCNLNYYQEAVNLLPNYPIIVFSDDVDWCKNNFNFSNSTYFVEELEDFVEMLLMSKITHNIIANSSFSWWSAYLNINKDKKVICPKIWFGPSGPQDWQDIYEEDWIRL